MMSTTKEGELPEGTHVHGLPEEGMDLNPQILIQVQNNFIAQSRVKEVQMEAAIQQLMAQNAEAASHARAMQERIAELEKELNPEVHVGADEVVEA